MLTDAELDHLSDVAVRTFERYWLYIQSFIDTSAGRHLSKQDAVRIAAAATEKMRRAHC